MEQRSDDKGQSAVLVAIAMLVLAIFAAITVDVSSAYLGRRTAQNAADGAALAAARELMHQYNAGVYNDTAIKIELNDFGERNGAEDTGGLLGDATNANVTGFYLDEEGYPISGAVIGGGSVPADAAGVEATVHITTPAFFGGIMGRGGYPVQAQAAVLLDIACGEGCVVPIATHSWAFTMTAPCYNIWNGGGPGNFGWLNWTWQEVHCHSDDCSSTCLAGNLEQEVCLSSHIRVGDWVAGTTGVSNDSKVRQELEDWIAFGPFTVVVWEETNGLTGCGNGPAGAYEGLNGLHYRVAGFARMELLGYQLSQGKAYPDVDEFDPSTCVTLGVPPKDGNRLSARFLGWAGGEGGNCQAVGTLRAPVITR